MPDIHEKSYIDMTFTSDYLVTDSEDETTRLSKTGVGPLLFSRKIS